jgi:cyanate lyase
MTAAPSLTSSWSEPSVSDHETARAQIEAEQHAEERRCAALVIASAARDTDDARTLLDMLGLDLDDIRAARMNGRAA